MSGFLQTGKFDVNFSVFIHFAALGVGPLPALPDVEAFSAVSSNEGLSDLDKKVSLAVKVIPSGKPFNCLTLLCLVCLMI